MPGEEIAVIRFSGLTGLDRLELEDALGTEAVRSVERPNTGTAHGDAGLTAILVTITPVAAAALATWLQGGERTIEKIERIKVEPNGSILVEKEYRENKKSTNNVRVFLDYLKERFKIELPAAGA